MSNQKCVTMVAMSFPCRPTTDTDTDHNSICTFAFTDKM